MAASRNFNCCLICNEKLDENISFDIFNKLLKSNGTLIAEALKRTFLIADLSPVSSDFHAVCRKCYIFIEDFCEWELKLSRLKTNLWNLYKSSILKRHQSLEDIFCGISTQTIENDEVHLENDEQKYHFLDVDNETPNNVDDTISEYNEESLQTWHRPETIPKSCGVCGVWCKSRQEIAIHMTVNHKDLNKQKIDSTEVPSTESHRRKCKFCLVIFKTVRDLKTHLKTHHHETIQYKCRICDRSLYSKTGAQYHAKTHDSRVDNAFDLEKAFEFLIQPTKHNEETTVVPDINEILLNAAELSSSEDEVPLSRRKELIIKKTKTVTSQVVNSLPQIKVVEETQENKSDIKLMKDDISSLLKLEVKQDGVNDTLVVKTVIDGIESETSRLKITRFGNNKLIRKLSKKAGEKSDATIKRIPKAEKGEREKSREDMLPPIREPKFKCEVCGKMWKSKGELNNHKGTHSDARPYICEICGQGYKHKHALDVHVGMHKGIFQHTCPFCNKAFTQKGALQRHLPIHTGELPYQCELCGKRFVHRTSFSIHTMAHSGVRNIKCPICNLGVLSKSHLRRHMRIHSGEKPYECAICGKTFAERYNLVAHQRVHDPSSAGVTRAPKKKQHTCRLCLIPFPTKPKLEEHMVKEHNKVKDAAQQSGLFQTTGSYQVPRFMVNESESSSKAESLNSEDDRRFIGTQTAEDNNKRYLLTSCEPARKINKVDIMRSSLDTSIVRVVDIPHVWAYPTS